MREAYRMVAKGFTEAPDSRMHIHRRPTSLSGRDGVPRHHSCPDQRQQPHIQVTCSTAWFRNGERACVRDLTFLLCSSKQSKLAYAVHAWYLAAGYKLVAVGEAEVGKAGDPALLSHSPEYAATPGSSGSRLFRCLSSVRWRCPVHTVHWLDNTALLPQTAARSLLKCKQRAGTRTRIASALHTPTTLVRGGSCRACGACSKLSASMLCPALLGQDPPKLGCLSGSCSEGFRSQSAASVEHMPLDVHDRH